MVSGLKRIKLCAVAAACAAGFLFAAANAHAAAIVQYDFPASWNGTGTTVIDQSGAGHNGVIVSAPTLSSNLPPGATAGTNSLATGTGAVTTSANSLLNNTAVAANGGFSYETWFTWDGTASAWNTQKIIDYAGTESLQLFNPAGPNVATGMELQIGFDGVTTGNVVDSSITLVPNTWYHVLATFNSGTNVPDPVNGLAGIATLSVDTGGVPIVDSGAVTKTIQGDGLTRPIGIGQLGANFGHLVYLKGDIYNPTVSLGVVPEPASLSLLGLAAFGLVTRRRR